MKHRTICSLVLNRYKRVIIQFTDRVRNHEILHFWPITDKSRDYRTFQTTQIGLDNRFLSVITVEIRFRVPIDLGKISIESADTLNMISASKVIFLVGCIQKCQRLVQKCHKSLLKFHFLEFTGYFSSRQFSDIFVHSLSHILTFFRSEQIYFWHFWTSPPRKFRHFGSLPESSEMSDNFGLLFSRISWFSVATEISFVGHTLKSSICGHHGWLWLTRITKVNKVVQCYTSWNIVSESTLVDSYYVKIILNLVLFRNNKWFWIFYYTGIWFWSSKAFGGNHVKTYACHYSFDPLALSTIDDLVIELHFWSNFKFSNTDSWYYFESGPKM